MLNKPNMAKNLNITQLPVVDEQGIKLLGVTTDKDVIHVDFDAAVKARVDKLIAEAAPLKIESLKDLQAFQERADKAEKDLKVVQRDMAKLKKKLESLLSLKEQAATEE